MTSGARSPGSDSGGVGPAGTGAADSARVARLVARARAGCAVSFDALFARYNCALYRFLCVRTGNSADAEELCQESWLRAWQKLATFDRRWRFSTWLFTLAARLTINRHRRQVVESEALGASPAGEPSCAEEGDPCELASRAEDRHNLWLLATQVLAEEARMALWLRYGEELQGREIALILDRNESSVRVLLFRARARLAKCLASQEARAQREPGRPAGCESVGRAREAEREADPSRHPIPLREGRRA